MIFIYVSFSLKETYLNNNLVTIQIFIVLIYILIVYIL